MNRGTRFQRIAPAAAAVLFAGMAGCGAPDQAAQAPAAPETQTVSRDIPYNENAHDILTLMNEVMEPAAQVFWGSAGWVIDAEGEHDLTPTTDEGWAATRASAGTVAALGNLLMTPLYSEGRGDDWFLFASALVDTALRAEQAAIARDSDAVFDTGAVVYRVCQACHQIYLPDFVAPPGS